jgi:transmembrane sensor
VDVERALAAVKSRPAARPQRSPARLSAFVKRVEYMAAAAAVLLVAGVFLFKRAGAPRQAGPEVAYGTGVGQRDSVTLGDGSVVLLAPASRIVVRDREVDLTGHAYFRVVHDDARPFTVRANGSVILDIGTEFAVAADSAQAVRVVVREGTVALQNDSGSVVLNQGDVGMAAPRKPVQASRGTAHADDTAWMHGRLVFRDASLDQVSADLRRWYGVQLRVTDSLLRRRVFTGSFTTEPVPRVLEANGLALGASIERRGDTAFVIPAAIK